MNNYFKKRIFMSVIGVFACGFSVGFFKRAELGVDPFQSLMSGLNALVPIEFGTLYVIVNICLLLFSLLTDRHYIGLATVINLSLLGYVAQFSHELLLTLYPVLSVPARFLFLIIGIITMCFSSAFYFVADLGVSTYDAIALIISKIWKIGKFKYVRIFCDLICILTGTILFYAANNSFSGLWSIVGCGTLITAFFMGPLIDFFTEHVAKPFLTK